MLKFFLALSDLQLLLICRLGPLICNWTMRFEAKNKYFKSLATRLGNFINLPYSLAMRHQQLQCYYNLNKEVISHELEVGPGGTVSADILRNLGMSMLSTDTLQVGQ